MSQSPEARFHSSTFMAEMPRWITSSVLRAAMARMLRPKAGLSRRERLLYCSESLRREDSMRCWEELRGVSIWWASVGLGELTCPIGLVVGSASRYGKLATPSLISITPPHYTTQQRSGGHLILQHTNLLRIRRFRRPARKPIPPFKHDRSRRIRQFLQHLGMFLQRLKCSFHTGQLVLHSASALLPGAD